MSAISMGDMLRYIRARQAGQTPESILSARIETHQEQLATRAQQVAEETLVQVAQNQETSESLNSAVEETRPTETAEEQVKRLKEASKQLQAVRDEASEKLGKVQKDLADQEKQKAEADRHLREITETLAAQKPTIPHLPFIYEAGQRASDSLNQRLNPKTLNSSSVRSFLSERANDSQKPFHALEERLATRRKQLEDLHPQQRISTNGSSLPELSERLQKLMVSGKPCRENGNGAHWQP